MLDQELINQISDTQSVRETPNRDSTDAIAKRAAAQLAYVQELIEHAAAAYSAIRPELTVVIPVYNEPETILEIVQRVNPSALPLPTTWDDEISTH